eukprot:11976615-Prorocentrum_lima.AAC.1
MAAMQKRVQYDTLISKGEPRCVADRRLTDPERGVALRRVVATAFWPIPSFTSHILSFSHG